MDGNNGQINAIKAEAKKRKVKVTIEAMRTTTDEQLTAARDELDASHRPLLIGVFPRGPTYADIGARFRVPDRETTRGNIVAQHHLEVSTGQGDRWTVAVPCTDFAASPADTEPSRESCSNTRAAHPRSGGVP